MEREIKSFGKEIFITLASNVATKSIFKERVLVFYHMINSGSGLKNQAAFMRAPV